MYNYLKSEKQTYIHTICIYVSIDIVIFTLSLSYTRRIMQADVLTHSCTLNVVYSHDDTQKTLPHAF